MNYFSAPGIIDVNERKEDHIIKVICRYKKISVRLMTSKIKTYNLAYARKLVYYFLYKKCDLSYGKIGKLLGNRDHTTVIHGIYTLQKLSEVYPDVQQDIHKLNEMI